MILIVVGVACIQSCQFECRHSRNGPFMHINIACIHSYSDGKHIRLIATNVNNRTKNSYSRPLNQCQSKRKIISVDIRKEKRLNDKKQNHNAYGEQVARVSHEVKVFMFVIFVRLIQMRKTKWLVINNEKFQGKYLFAALSLKIDRDISYSACFECSKERSDNERTSTKTSIYGRYKFKDPAESGLREIIFQGTHIFSTNWFFTGFSGKFMYNLCRK